MRKIIYTPIKHYDIQWGSKKSVFLKVTEKNELH
jgi:hypothetical protein